MERIVFLERNTFRVDFARPSFRHEWIEFGETEGTQIEPRLRDCTIAIVNKLHLRDRLLSQLPKLKLIAVAATGVDNIDLEYCRSNGIAVCNARGYGTVSVPEHVLTLIFALRRNLISYRDAVRAGEWQKAKQFCLLDDAIHEIRGSTLGVIGFGSLGKAVAELCSAMGMNVIVADRKGSGLIREGRVPFNTALSESDVLTLHCPLTTETIGLIGEAEFRKMKSSSLLINAARGGLVDEAALIVALREGWIAGAGFDVLTKEPPVEGNRLIDLNLPNFILTPHVAWSSREAMQTLANQLIDSIEAFVRGEEKNRVV